LLLLVVELAAAIFPDLLVTAAAALAV